MRQRLKQVFSELSHSGSKQLVVYGTGELAELAYLTLRELDFTLVGFVDGKQEGTFLSYPLCHIESLPNWKFDALLVADLEEAEKVRAKIIREGVPREKVVILAPSG